MLKIKYLVLDILDSVWIPFQFPTLQLCQVKIRRDVFMARASQVQTKDYD